MFPYLERLELLLFAWTGSDTVAMSSLLCSPVWQRGQQVQVQHQGSLKNKSDLFTGYESSGLEQGGPLVKLLMMPRGLYYIIQSGAKG